MTAQVIPFRVNREEREQAAGGGVPVMWSIRQASEMTGLPEHFIRTLVRQQKIHAVQAGSKKYFISKRSLCAFLDGTDGEEVAANG